jgi:MFS transporter, AAHS family, 4-hydroxybenzoate transporter
VSAEPTFDIRQVIEQQQSRGFATTLIAGMALMMLTEGYDLGAMAFAAPTLSRAWHLDRGALGPVFGAFVFGTMIGAFVLGYLGDVIGRKRTLVIGSLIVSLFSLAAAQASQLNYLLAMRFLVGIGVGGVVPNAIAYISEFAPKQWRATWITLMYSGYTIGSGIGGLVAAFFVPRFGWQVVFWIGGTAPLLTGTMLWIWVPESIRFLTLKGGRNKEVARIIARMAPDLKLPGNARFIVGHELEGSERTRQNASIRLLFSENLRSLTVVLWAVYIANSMALFFLSAWLPMLIEGTGMPPQRASLVSAMYQFGGTLGGLALMRFIDKRGAGIIGVLPLFGTPLVAILGLTLPIPVLVTAVFFVGFAIIGTQFGLNAVAALIYPTALRAKGTGAAVGVQKIGAIAGPVIGGTLLSAQLPVQQLFYLGAIPVAFVALLIFLLGRLQNSNADHITTDVAKNRRSGAAYVA